MLKKSVKNSAFNQEQYNNIYPDGIQNYFWNKARNHILHQTVSKFANGEAILEIGCGRGIVVSYLSKKGVNITGIDIAELTPLDDAKNNIITGADAILMDEDFKHKFTTIMLLDVIEHISNPTTFLNNILKEYKNVNKLIITVPSRMEIWSNYDVYCGHYIRYDQQTLRDAAKSVSGRVLYISYFFHLLYAAAAILAKGSINRNTHIKAPKGIISKLYHHLLSYLFIAEYRLIPKKIYGSSLISVWEINRNQ